MNNRNGDSIRPKRPTLGMLLENERASQIRAIAVPCLNALKRLVNDDLTGEQRNTLTRDVLQFRSQLAKIGITPNIHSGPLLPADTSGYIDPALLAEFSAGQICAIVDAGVNVSKGSGEAAAREFSTTVESTGARNVFLVENREPPASLVDWMTAQTVIEVCRLDFQIQPREVPTGSNS